jgi:hypothetical protein
MDDSGIGCGCGLILPAHPRDQWRDLVNMGMKLRVPQKVRKFKKLNDC